MRSAQAVGSLGSPGKARTGHHYLWSFTCGQHWASGAVEFILGSGRKDKSPTLGISK